MYPLMVSGCSGTGRNIEHIPWFRGAHIAAISRIEVQGKGHLYWPDLDVDLSLEIIENPEKFPLASRRAS